MLLIVTKFGGGRMGCGKFVSDNYRILAIGVAYIIKWCKSRLPYRGHGVELFQSEDLGRELAGLQRESPHLS